MKPWKLLIALLSPALAAPPLPAEIIERVVAKVNGEIITLSDFTARQISEAQAARVSPDRIEQFLRENNARILQSAIDDLLIVQKAADIGLRVPPAYLKDVIENIKKENNIESDEAFMQQLQREGMSLDDLKRNIERSILSRQVVSREVDSKIQLGDPELRAEYEARKADYTTPAKLRLQEIVIKGDGGEARERAAQIVQRARAGEDFSALAREHSSAPSRASGGDLGELVLGEMNPEIEKIAGSLAAGEVSDAFPRGDSLAILRVASRSEGRVVPFDEVKAELGKRLKETRRSEEYDKFIAGLRKTAILDVRVREVPLQVDLPSSGSILDPAGPEPAAGTAPAGAAPAAEPQPKPDPDAEFSVTPQARPERVAPEPPPAIKPTPAPTPTPRP
jgi:peptidyl-prolyl cis-trans isomerase SurA